MDAVHVVGAARAGRASWREALAAVQSSDLFRLSQSRNSVYLPVAGMPAEAKLVFKLTPDAVKEAALMVEISRHVPDVRIPRILQVEEDLLVTELVEGETLNEQLRRGDFGALPAAVETTAALHEKLPQLWEPTNLAARLEKRLQDPYLGISGQFVADLVGAMEPFIEILNAQGACAYLDRIPGNYMVTQSQNIIAIDFEGAEWCHGGRALDLANLLSFTDETTHLWNEGVTMYVAHHEGSHRDFWAAFCAAVICRALCYTAAWSRPRQAHLRSERVNALDRALLAIDLLKPALSLNQLKPVQGALHRLNATITEGALAAAA